MAIPFSDYINITSGIGAGSVVNTRSFIARVFTTNPLLPTNSYLEFSTLAAVGNYFGTTSEEYLRASFYFNFISKNITRPQLISFARWTNVAVHALIFGAQVTDTLAQFNLITNAVFSLTIGATTVNIGPLDFSAAASFAAIATEIQTAINTSIDPQFATATVTYDALTGGFNLVSGQTGNAAISVAAGTGGTDIHIIMGWGANAIFSNGSVSQTITQTLTESADLSDNFGSFCFTNASALNLSQITEAAIWNSGQNITYMFMAPPATNLTDTLSYYNALNLYGGTCLTYNTIVGQYPEMLPMAIFAATDFTQQNSVQNYMFYQAALSPSVTDGTTSDTLDSELTNYYGNTQTAGNNISFYQRGVLLGPATSPSDINVYANEIWLKDAAGVALMQLLLNVGRVPANRTGRGQIFATLQSVINQALNNGTISSEKPLTPLQILYISEITGDPDAYHQVGGIGYWLDVQMSSFTNSNSGLTEYQATYLLVYSKDDSIRYVQGTHVLI